MDKEEVVSQGEDVTEETQTEETDTSDASSSEDETAQETGGDDSASSTKGTEGNSVPYERFREVNERAKKAEALEAKVAELEKKLTQPKEVDPQTDEIKARLKPILDDLGYVSKDELQKQKEDEYVQGEITRLSGKYDGSDGKPKFEKDEVIKFALSKNIGDIETAYEKLHQKELINWHIKQAQLKSKGIKTETSDGSGSSEAGTTNDDLKEAIAKGDNKALRTFIKRVARITR